MLASEFRPSLLGGVQVVTASAVALSRDKDDAIVRTNRSVTLIPYATWANRGPGPMAVWLASVDDTARPRPFPTLATRSTVTTSPARRSPRFINDGEMPASSADPSSYFDWWPRKGETAWVEYALPEVATIDRVSVYWFDDTGRGEVRVPASWSLQYKDGDTWRPVQGASPYGTARDRPNVVTFAPVRTTALRLDITMQPGFSAGIQEWSSSVTLNA